MAISIKGSKANPAAEAMQKKAEEKANLNTTVTKKVKKETIYADEGVVEVGGIEDNVPIPPLMRGGRTSKYRFIDMEVGHSFPAKGISVQQMHGALQNFRKKMPSWKFTVRSMPDGVRVWRTE